DQSLDAGGTLVGEPPATETLGFRWSAVHNLFLTSADFAADEWRASRATDQECAEREMRQFVWCVPVESSKWSQTPLEVLELAARLGSWPRGVLPPDTKWLTAAVDIGKYLLHWVLVAWRDGATGHVVDYGRIEVASADLGVEQAVMVALREFREMAQAGWALAGGAQKVPDQIWIDAGYMTDVVYSFSRESGRNHFRPSVGRGATQQRKQNYNRPNQQGGNVAVIGQGFHLNLQKAEQLFLVEVDADFWKTWVHQRLGTPLTSSGALTFYQTLPQEHLALARHLTAEIKTEEFVPGQGVVVRWERLRKDNHFFDALYNACAAGYLCGARLIDERPPPKQPRKPQVMSSGFTRRDGRPWVDLSRWHGIKGS
ncbi:MAG: phage terminase large subunit family protein, partial [Pirellulaceae bacterium]|nr:phage terminase large subunit family protein [Pirellulaceae bacterium]